MKRLLTDAEADEAAKLSQFLMEQQAFPPYAGRDTFDARIVTTACAGMAGAYLYGLSNDLKFVIGQAFVEGFIQYAGLPLRVDMPTSGKS